MNIRTFYVAVWNGINCTNMKIKMKLFCPNQLNNAANSLLWIARQPCTFYAHTHRFATPTHTSVYLLKYANICVWVLELECYAWTGEQNCAQKLHGNTKERVQNSISCRSVQSFNWLEYQRVISFHFMFVHVVLRSYFAQPIKIFTSYKTK